MGKLAERLADFRRSGVARVESTTALEEAAGLCGHSLSRVDLGDADAASLFARCRDALGAGHAADWPTLRAALAEPTRSSTPVLLFSRFEAAIGESAGALDPLFAVLEDLARAARGREAHFFAVFFDPHQKLSLAPLYHWHRESSSTQSRAPTTEEVPT